MIKLRVQERLVNAIERARQLAEDYAVNHAALLALQEASAAVDHGVVDRQGHALLRLMRGARDQGNEPIDRGPCLVGSLDGETTVRDRRHAGGRSNGCG